MTIPKHHNLGRVLDGSSGHGKLVTADWLEENRGIPKHRAYDLARQNLIPHVRLGRQVRFLADQVDTWLDGGGSSLPGGWRKEAPTK